MMDKKPHVKPYLYGMLAGFGAISLSIIFFFLIYRFDGFGDAISTLTGILMPFIYGAVIAYLLKPVCNTIESFLRRFIPEKMHGLVNVLSVTLTILFGLLLIYALCMMIIPQLITSVTTLYYTAQRNLTKFVQWANHVEFIENNQQIMDMLNSAYATVSTNIDDLIKTPAALHAEHRQRCRSGCAERSDHGQEPDHRHHRGGVYAGQPQAVRAAGQAGALQHLQAPLGGADQGRSEVRRQNVRRLHQRQDHGFRHHRRAVLYRLPDLSSSPVPCWFR